MLGTAAGCYHESGLWSAVSVLGCAMKNSKQTPSELGSCAGLHFKLPFVATVRATGCSRWISGTHYGTRTPHSLVRGDRSTRHTGRVFQTGLKDAMLLERIAAFRESQLRVPAGQSRREHRYFHSIPLDI